MRIVVTGATGNVGRLLVNRLVVDGHDVRAVTRSQSRMGAIPNATMVHLENLTSPGDIAHAIDGADAIFLNPRAVGAGYDLLLAVAADRGVRRAVALSAANVEEDPSHQPSRFNGDLNTEVEHAVVGSGLEWVALRPTYFSTNAIGMYASQIRIGNVVHGPFADFAETPLDLNDVADVAALALTGDELVGRKPVLTGPESLTQSDMVARIGEVLGRRLAFEEVPAEVARQGMLASGLRETFVDAYLARMERGHSHLAEVGPELSRALSDARPRSRSGWPRTRQHSRGRRDARSTDHQYRHRPHGQRHLQRPVRRVPSGSPGPGVVIARLLWDHVRAGSGGRIGRARSIGHDDPCSGPRRHPVGGIGQPAAARNEPLVVTAAPSDRGVRALRDGKPADQCRPA